MIIAARQALGANLEELLLQIGRRNPAFELMGSQKEFVYGFEKHLAAG